MFLNEVTDGMQGRASTIPGKFPMMDSKTGVLWKKMIYAYGANVKTGKTGYIDERYILYPYLKLGESLGSHVKYLYFSYEIDLIEKMAAFTSYLAFYRHDMRISSDKILGRLGVLTPSEFEVVKLIHDTDLKILFGEFDRFGRRSHGGLIEFHTVKENPTGIYKRLMNHASANGHFEYELLDDGRRGRRLYYSPSDGNLITLSLIDHVGLVPRERGYTVKQNLDKLSEYAVELRNECQFSFVFTSQFNREMGKIDRLKFSGEQLAPTLEDFKDTSNIGQDANQVFGLLNPSRYKHLKTHFGYDMSKFQKTIRTAHLLANRNGESDMNYALFFDGAIKRWAELPLPNDKENLKKWEDAAKELLQNP